VNRGERTLLGPPDASRHPRFTEPATFARLPRIDQVPDAEVKIVGIPFDSGVSYRPGARFGPAHVRASSKLLRPFNPALNVEPFGVQQVADCGDVAVNPFNIEDAITSIDTAITELRGDGSTILTIGGDHTIALPILRSLARDHGPIAVLHFDAHLDTWDTYFGAPYTHGTPFRRASEEGLIDMERALHIGIRGPLYSRQDLEDSEVLGFQVIRSDDYEVDGVASIVERMRARLDGGPVYVSVDIDCLDPAHAPGTGTPEAGGMTSRELLNTLRGLVGLNIVGADIVEVAPAYDHAEITGIAAAHVGYELLSVLAANAHTGPGDVESPGRSAEGLDRGGHSRRTPAQDAARPAIHAHAVTDDLAHDHGGAWQC
jgi:agmatinase